MHLIIARPFYDSFKGSGLKSIFRRKFSMVCLLLGLGFCLLLPD